MLAKSLNDNAGRLVHSGVLRFFASKLAPTVLRDRSHDQSDGDVVLGQEGHEGFFVQHLDAQLTGLGQF